MRYKIILIENIQKNVFQDLVKNYKKTKREEITYILSYIGITVTLPSM